MGSILAVDLLPMAPAAHYCMGGSAHDAMAALMFLAFTPLVRWLAQACRAPTAGLELAAGMPGLRATCRASRHCGYSKQFAEWPDAKPSGAWRAT